MTFPSSSSTVAMPATPISHSGSPMGQESATCVSRRRQWVCSFSDWRRYRTSSTPICDCTPSIYPYIHTYTCESGCVLSLLTICCMGKKNVTKSADQRLRLEGFYERRQGGWQREEIMAISRAAGLTRQQVYKWLWDRKRAEKQKTRSKNGG